MQLTNVGAIVEKIEHELRFAPNVKSHRRNIRQTLSAVHAAILGEFAWPFMQRVEPMLVLPDLTFTNAQVFRLTSRTWYITGASLATALGLLDGDATAISEYARLLHGATFEAADPQLAAEGLAGTWAKGPFEIEHATVDTGNTIFTLDPRFASTSKTGDEGDFVIKFPRYQLPPMTEQVVELRDRTTRARLTPITTQDAQALSATHTGRPTLWWPNAGLSLRYQPGDVKSTALTPVFLARNKEAFGMQMDAPVSIAAATKTAPAGFVATATNSGSGALPAGKYRVFLAWAVAGRLSPPSAIAEVTVASPNDSFDLTGLPVLDEATRGRRLTVWVSFNEGPFYLDQDVDSTSAVGHPQYADPSRDDWYILVSTGTWTKPWMNIRWDEVYRGPTPQYIGVWPRPAEPAELELVYRKAPRDLISDEDAPELPAVFNDLLVWETVKSMAVAHSDPKLMAMAKSLAADRMRALRTAFGMTDAVRQMRSQVDQPASVQWNALFPAIDHRP